MSGNKVLFLAPWEEVLKLVLGNCASLACAGRKGVCVYADEWMDRCIVSAQGLEKMGRLVTSCPTCGLCFLDVFLILERSVSRMVQGYRGE